MADHWSILEKLVLVSAMDKLCTTTDWQSISRSIREYFRIDSKNSRNETGVELYAADKCRAQYFDLLDSHYKPDDLSSVTFLMKKLSADRVTELNAEVNQIVLQFNKAKKDLEILNSPDVSTDQINLMWDEMKSKFSLDDTDEHNISGLIRDLAEDSDIQSINLDTSADVSDNHSLTSTQENIYRSTVPLSPRGGLTNRDFDDPASSPASSVISFDESEFDRAASRQFKKSAIVIWKSIANHKWANVFMHPVTDDIAPNYSKIIMKPMDLSLIKRNIENGSIRNNEDFVRDVLLMLQNALFYNNSDHQVYHLASEMQRDVLALFQQNLGTDFFAGMEVPSVNLAEARPHRTRNSKS